ncbi:MAG: hypothetical protein HY330_04730, partial [Chloroflexi bacterium]|nr:hypothetical protein [Chloroflexota bacterium]
LRLSEEASEPAVRTAYRHLAAEAQGDQRPGDEPIERRLAQLRQASDLLVRYCRARGRAEAGAGGPGTARADGDGVFAIAIEGLRSADIAPARFGGVVTARQG